MIPLTWTRVDTNPDEDFVVAPDQRLSWPRTLGIGAQHVVAMFGATFLVPLLPTQVGTQGRLVPPYVSPTVCHPG